MKKLSISRFYPKYAALTPQLYGYKIAHISDLHNANLGGQIENAIAQDIPNIIVLTGDIISFESRYANAISLITNLLKLAPVFYVNGNHEGRFKGYDTWHNRLADMGVICLRNQVRMIEHNNASLAIIGMDDPKFFDSDTVSRRDKFRSTLSGLALPLDGTFRVLLSHRPSYFDFYASLGIELTFSGHVHGGQIRIPKIGALYAPGHGLLPKNVDGLNRIDDSYMAVSRGLSQTFRTPPRIFNPPELVFCTLSPSHV